MSTDTVPVHTDCPQCPECSLPCAAPAALMEVGDTVGVRELRCQACGHEWHEEDAAKAAQAWWSAGAWEAERRRAGDEPMTWDDVARRLP